MLDIVIAFNNTNMDNSSEIRDANQADFDSF